MFTSLHPIMKESIERNVILIYDTIIDKLKKLQPNQKEKISFEYNIGCDYNIMEYPILFNTIHSKLNQSELTENIKHTIECINNTKYIHTYEISK